MKYFCTTIVIVLTICDAKLLKRSASDKVINLIENAGYQGEAHRVITEDGYYLMVHRVLPKNTKNTVKLKPVFLMHGMGATSADFLLTGPEIALGFLLSDNGYDVWLGNARGNTYSMKHQNYSSSSKEFWTFSWHEIGYYDLAASLDYLLRTTRSSKAFYAAHSQGTTALLVLLSTRPQYNEKLVQVHLMAPSAFRKKLPRLRALIYLFEFLVI